MDENKLIWDFISDSVTVVGNTIHVIDKNIFVNIPETFGYIPDKDISSNFPKSHINLVEVLGHYGYLNKGFKEFTVYHKNFVIQFVNGKVNSLNDNPAFTLNVTKDNVYSRGWYKNNKLHRDNDLPSLLETLSIDSKNLTVVWYKDGKLHRKQVPAIMRMCDGEVEEFRWYEEGEEIKKIHLEINPQTLITNLGITPNMIYPESSLSEDMSKHISYDDK